MNANELVEYFEEQLDFCKSQMSEINCAGKEYYGEQLSEIVDELTSDIDRLGSLLSILSHARIRETATEPPTREDADKYNRVLAYDNLSETWLRASPEMIARDPRFEKWTQLPEVTP